MRIKHWDTEFRKVTAWRDEIRNLRLLFFLLTVLTELLQIFADSGRRIYYPPI
jgi:hypothetical protein